MRNQQIGVEPVFVLYFACLEEEMVRRVLSCNEGRVDDNIETIKRRLKVFRELNLPVINHYTARGEVRKINAVGTIDEVFDNIRSHFVAYEVPVGRATLGRIINVIGEPIDDRETDHYLPIHREAPFVEQATEQEILVDGIKVPCTWKFTKVFTTRILDDGVIEEKDQARIEDKNLHIVFVLGGPGSGKGTQCSKIVDTFGFSHLSAGELLRREMSSDTEIGAMICDTIKEGKIVPSEVTVKLLHKHMEANENNKFLIDGFPRTDENRVAFEQFIGVEPVFVLYFECPEEEMVRRVLSRNEGRIDDNIETIKKRLKVFRKLNLPVINHYSARGKVHKINAVGTIDGVFDNIRSHFVAYEGTSWPNSGNRFLENNGPLRSGGCSVPGRTIRPNSCFHMNTY
ncbi:probable UMP-CMP kinase 2 isoform X9 [Amborella trichopoda]|uniref:probable UMP-CMP kinase 2 isoform X9 n=1 Tax=Amborella trichopoda TaxID=13333 RepID=UPI0009BE9308|nr:probable UMP-CMP kinase 2 isoform X9 [Amborella trichopoda]|eukprot:XP_020522599.1 probable UMP-CMP kinase 2 isoform X9 [Amborella trichopoda]